VGTFIEPLDFKTIFMDYLLGSPELFFYALILVISFACAKFGMSNKIFLIVLMISCLLFASILGQAIYILILLVIGFVAFKALSRLFTN
jgi:hypothetical protein